MISNFEAIKDEVFGEVEPNWDEVIRLAHLLNATELGLVKVMRLQWLEHNDPARFDGAIMNEL